MKKLRNMEKTCPDMFNEKYWSTDGTVFNYIRFYRDLGIWIHELTERLENTKNTFPNTRNILAMSSGKFPKDFPYEEFCRDVINWFRYEFGTYGLISRKDRRKLLDNREE